MWLLALLFCIALGDVPLPQDKSATTPVCDDSAELVIGLMTQSSLADATSQECSDLGTYVSPDNVQAAPLDVQCACYTADGVDLDALYIKDCRLTEPDPYLVSETAMYCNNDDQLIGETTVQVVDKETTTFDLSNWEGVTGDSISQGQMLRKTFTVDDQGSDVVYIAFSFDTIANDQWQAGDEMVVELGVDPWNANSYVAELTPSATESHTVILSLDKFGDQESGQEHTFTVGFTTNLASADPSYWISMTTLGVYTRQEVAVICRGKVANVGTEFYPEFDIDRSGFFDINSGNTLDSEKIRFTMRVPRYYYDFTVDFEGGSGFAGYSESRVYSEDVDDLTKTYWEWAGVSEDPCGYEDLVAEIPWTVLNENDGGNLALVEAWNNGTYVDTDDTFYKFVGTVLMTGNEHVYTSATEEQTGASREWETERELEWRVPFVIRMQRIVLVATTMDVNPPDLLINYVAAMTRYVQADTVYDLDDREYRAFVTMDITTLTLFPYMLIPGNNDDDPPIYFESMTPPLDTGSWWPPTIKFTPTNYPEVTVQTNISWISEVRDDCTFIDSSDIRSNDARECEQFWRFDVTPLDGSCFIDGTYEIEFGARCFYDKPTCLFNTDEFGRVSNSVVLILDVESTNMCPELVQDVAIQGEMCDTGREGWTRCADVSIPYPCGHDQDFCDGPPHPTINTYFQNDDAYFFVEVESTDAKIIYSEITDIWTTPTSTLDPLVPNDPNLFTTQIYTAGVANGLSWTNSQTGQTESVRPIIWRVENSNYFADQYASQGTGDTDYGNFAGFAVFLDERVFPAPTDGFYDVTFTVTVKVWYEGWGDQKTSRRQLVEMEIPLNGNDQMMVQKPVSIMRRPIKTTECEERSNMHWAVHVGSEQESSTLATDMAKLLDSNDFTFAGQHELNDEHVAVFSTQRSDLWDRLDNALFARSRTFQTSSFSHMTSVTCMDIPVDSAPTSFEVAQCSTSQPCSFYDGLTLDQYQSVRGNDRNTPILQQSDEDSVSALSILFAAIMLLAHL